jgi:hypothetical protein
MSQNANHSVWFQAVTFIFQVHTVEVAGSNPAAPTIKHNILNRIMCYTF